MNFHRVVRVGNATDVPNAYQQAENPKFPAGAQRSTSLS